LVFPFVTYLFLLEDLLTNENIPVYGIYLFIFGFSIQLTTIILRTTTLSKLKENLTKRI
jgi:hypothetical protein